MPSRASKGRDFFANARRVVEQAIGEHMDGTPFEDPDAGKNPAALALSKLGASKGGKARALKLSPAERKQIAKKAAARDRVALTKKEFQTDPLPEPDSGSGIIRPCGRLTSLNRQSSYSGDSAVERSSHYCRGQLRSRPDHESSMPPERRRDAFGNWLSRGLWREGF
jgi:hypothetical protein